MYLWQHIAQASSVHLLFTFPIWNLVSKKGWILVLAPSRATDLCLCLCADISLSLIIQLLLMMDPTEIKLWSEFTVSLIPSLYVSQQLPPWIWISLFTLPFLHLVSSPNQNPQKTMKGFPLAAADLRKAVCSIQTLTGLYSLATIPFRFLLLQTLSSSPWYFKFALKLWRTESTTC